MLHEIRPPDAAPQLLNRRERELVLHLARTACPAGDIFPAADAGTVEQVDRFLARLPPATNQSYRATLRVFDVAVLLRHGRRFGSLDPDEQLRVLERWRTAGAFRRLALRWLLSPIKVVHFSNRELYEHIGCVYDYDSKPEAEPRYMTERVHDATAAGEELEVECDVVVVGTGAGGAVVAKELAERGHAVVMLEEGAYFKRHDFSGRAFDMQHKMYRGAGLTGSIGNVPVLIPTGVAVGGSTTINSGTCYRIPDRVLAKWRDELGLAEFTPEHLSPYYDRVEQVLRVTESRAEHLGGVARVIARGCDRLGYQHKPLRRNAPDCDGQGMCCFGCPTDAKRSTNVSYVPLALRAGAQLFHNARAETILTENGRAAGVVAHTVDANGEGRAGTLTVRARIVVVACGTLNTPHLLEKSGLANSSGALGTNLSIHPALVANAVFDEEIAGYNAIPQGYAIEEFHDEGLLYEGGSMPVEVNMVAMSALGPDAIELAERYRNVATFGFMIEDSSRGRVRTIRGQRIITYNVNKRDLAKMKRGMELLIRIFLAAGAVEVRPWMHRFDRISSRADLTRFRHAKLRASDFDLTAYHPLGTARMGIDPSSSVVGPDNQTHDVPGLFVVDGSSVPSSVGVNPMVTIMALATRAADHIDRHQLR